MKKLLTLILCLSLIASASASRVPVVGSDNETWGGILNDFLISLGGQNATELNLTMVNGSNIYPSAINSTHIQDGTINSNDLANNSVKDNEIDYSEVTLADFTNDANYLNKSEGGTIDGSLILNGNLTLIGSYLNATVTNQYLNGSFFPDVKDLFNLGSEVFKWANLYVGNIYASKVYSDDWTNVSITKSQVSDADWWNSNDNISADEISESKIGFSTSCASGNHLYVNGNDLACEADNTGMWINVSNTATYDGDINVTGTSYLGSMDFTGGNITATRATLTTLNVTGTSYLGDFQLDGDVDLNDGDLTTTGNVTASHFFGDGSQLTNVSSNTNDGTTSGQMTFWNGTEWTYADTGELYWDDTNKRVGVGTSNPLSTLHINGGVGSLSTGLTFGDGDTGFYESADDTLRLSRAGSDYLTFYDYGFGGSAANGPYIMLESASATNPVFVLQGDVDTGIGRAGANILSLIAGGVNGLNVDGTGKVGIGTSSPSSALDIIGNVEITPSTPVSPSDPALKIWYPGSTTEGIEFRTGWDTMDNTYIGHNSGKYSSSGILHNTGIGYYALRSAYGSSNTAIGWNALAKPTGSNNVAIGQSALQNNVAGTGNMAVGTNALINNVGGIYNVAIGINSLYASTGNYNTGIGYESGRKLASGANNIFIGYSAGYRQTAVSNLLIIDNQRRADVATEETNAILYGTMATTPTNQNLRINANTNIFGNVGIGTSSPQNALNVVGDVNATSGFSVGGSVGLTENYSVGSCWIYYTGGIMTSTNCTVS